MRSSPHADPERGLFETLLVFDGRAVEIEAHLERLRGSLASVYGVDLPDEAASAIAVGARPLRRGRLRLTAAPSAGSVQISIVTAKVDEAEVFPADQGVALRSFAVEGGLGSHKWADRRVLDRLADTVASGEVPLLVDAGGEVLEASRANVFAIRDGVLVTPPVDGRIVPGIARARTVQLARAEGRDVREEQLSLDDLLAADEVFLTNSVRGIEPVCSIDGTSSGGGEVGGGAELATALRRRWLQVPQGEPVAVVAGGRRAGRHAR